MNKLIPIFLLLAGVLPAKAVYVAVEYASGRAKIINVVPPVVEKDNVIYPVPADLVKLSRDELVVDYTSGSRVLRRVTDAERSLRKSQPHLVCPDNTSPVGLKWSNGVVTNFVDSVAEVPSNLWQTVTTYRQLMQASGFDPYSPSNTYSSVAASLVGQGLQNNPGATLDSRITESERRLNTVINGIVMERMYEQIREAGYELAWEVPATQVYTNKIPVFTPVCP